MEPGKTNPQGEQFEMKSIAPYIFLAAACLVLPSVAKADSVTTGSSTVNAYDDIYAAGSQSALAGGSGSQTGAVPGSISVAGSTYVTLNAIGSATINAGGNFNDPDGFAAGTSTSIETGYGSISGITAPGRGYLVGVFVGPGGPTGAAPASLTYTTADTEDASYDPLLDQVFFIGDGLTGDGTGTNQEFYVPTGATELYLGISDASGYDGAPNCYADNFGGYSVTYTDTTTSSTPPSAVPEPSSLLLLATGALSAAGTLRRRTT
jgi:hypothetical protein